MRPCKYTVFQIVAWFSRVKMFKPAQRRTFSEISLECISLFSLRGRGVLEAQKIHLGKAHITGKEITS